MRTKSGRIARMTGGALALAMGAGVVLGAAPANAAWFGFSIELGYHGSARPSDAAAQNETRAAADQRCLRVYGFRARGVTPVVLYPENGNWYQAWRCDSN